MSIRIEEYAEDTGTIKWQEGFLKELEGLTIEEQLRCFALTEHKRLTEVPYNKVESKCREENFCLNSTNRIDSEIVLVKDGMIVGIKVRKFFFDPTESKSDNFLTIRPYEGYCYASTSDNNGAGYKETDWYKYLICLPYNHTLW